ncbi:hypothetical protein [Acinetobacter nosocomialis]|uniref:hypothetical protein n=1 Tax=Acinetobacter nosocomialis TaxID=106654 RepID=UPI00125D67F7|nr:hypothetical protein [Acinetobacter nosocomialis]
MIANTKKEPKKTGIDRTVWLFETEVLQKYLGTNLKDHHKVLQFNIFAMKYEIKPKFDNGRLDAICLRDKANELIKIWFIAFQSCTGEQMRLSRGDQ